MVGTCSRAVCADYRDDIGYTRLASELGLVLPTGAGVLASQVESRTDGGNPPDSTPNYLPDPNHAEFVGKQLLELSANGAISNHATIVGRRYYGTETSIAPGIDTVGLYWTDDWLDDGFLRSSSVVGPARSSYRVFNHSWVGSGSGALGIVKRLDYLIETYDQIQVTAVNNDPNPTDGNNPVQPLLTDAFNVVAVGLTSGNHAVGTTNLGGFYTNTRTRPHFVAPATATSNAAPTTAAAAALLIETAHGRPELSHGSYSVQTDAADYTVQHGETSEVIRAVLMAGAQRLDVAGYSPTSTNRLDGRFGAGELDIYNSYHILVAGEQDSLEHGGSASGIDRRGFDYVAGFASGEIATYSFVPDANATLLSATLSWNMDIVGGTSRFDTGAMLANLDLTLVRHDAGGDIEVAVSDSTNESTENLWLDDLVPGVSHSLLVTRNDGFGTWDYGLAWQLVHDPALPLFGDMNGDLAVDAGDIAPFMLALTNRPSFDAIHPTIDADLLGDVNRDGLFNNLDIDSFNVMLGGGPPLLVELNPGSSTPEPAAWTLLAISAIGALRWRRAAWRAR